jgi:hypothetical protein
VVEHIAPIVMSSKPCLRTLSIFIIVIIFRLGFFEIVIYKPLRQANKPERFRHS